MRSTGVTTAFGGNYFHEPGLPVQVCHVNRQKGITHPHDLTEVEHIHDFIEIVVIMGGSGRQVIQGETYPVTAGDVFVLQGFQSHRFSDCGKLDILNVMFDPARSPELVNADVDAMSGYQALFVLEPRRRNNKRFGNMLRLGFEPLREAEQIIRRIERELKDRPDGYRIMVRTQLEMLLVLLSRAYMELERPNAQGMIRIQRAIDHIEANYAGVVRIEDLASEVCMSPRHFQRLFRTVTGVSPNTYLQKVRIRQACELLSSDDARISEVAGAVGFQDRHYFSRMFKKRMGVQPKKFKKGLSER